MYRVQGPLREHVTMDAVRRFIGKKFKKFLETYVNPKSGNGELEYMRLINEMVLGEHLLHCNCTGLFTFGLFCKMVKQILFSKMNL